MNLLAIPIKLPMPPEFALDWLCTITVSNALVRKEGMDKRRDGIDLPPYTS